MAVPSALASANEIHAYLVDEMNQALRRPGMYGGEMALGLILRHLLFAERDQDDWTAQRQRWERRGLWTSTGVKGAFQRLLPQAGDHDTASAYAEYAHTRDWLRSERVLSAEEYAPVRAQARTWAAERDRGWADVTAAFGPPSVHLGGTNPRYGKVLGYLNGKADEPIVWFHLGDGGVLHAVRFGDGPFAETFTHTPEGRRRRRR